MMGDPNMDPRLFHGLGPLSVMAAQVGTVITKNGAAIIISAVITAAVTALIPYVLIIPRIEERQAHDHETLIEFRTRLDSLSTNVSQNALGQVRSVGEDNSLKLRMSEVERRLREHEEDDKKRFGVHR